MPCNQTPCHSAHGGSYHGDRGEHHNADETLPKSGNHCHLSGQQRNPRKQEPDPKRLRLPPLHGINGDESDGDRKEDHEAQRHDLKHRIVREDAGPETYGEPVERPGTAPKATILKLTFGAASSMPLTLYQCEGWLK